MAAKVSKQRIGMAEARLEAAIARLEQAVMRLEAQGPQVPYMPQIGHAAPSAIRPQMDCISSTTVLPDGRRVHATGLVWCK